MLRSSLVVGVMSSAMLTAPSVALGVTGAETPSRSEGTVVVSGVLDRELRTLAEREAAHPELVEFVGGNPVVIVVGSTALLVILVVVLLLLLFQ